MQEGRRTRFGELSLDAFVERLASAEPVPGGGSASAVAAALGASLLAMVASLSTGRPKFADHESTLAEAGAIGRGLIRTFLDLADEDAQAYAAFAAALKLPRETDSERETRRAAMSDAALLAAETPLRCVERCLELAAAVESLAGRSNPNASSDLVVAANLAEAAARGAAANVLVNVPSIADQEVAGDLVARSTELVDEIERIASSTRETVLSGEQRDPLPVAG
ncbi:MAG TPA: cyclodeaminase/cyclohydrolase family protein [Candidatus Limnocylindrales bacterium]